jgi:SAM-dependent methyltransferase
MTMQYTSHWCGLRSFMADAIRGYRTNAGRHSDMVASRIQELREIEQRIFNTYNFVLRDLDVLEIGPGPVPVQLMCLGRHNRVTGIDINYMPKRRTPLTLYQVYRKNGPVRSLKTMGRWLTGIDSQYRREASRQVGSAPTWPEILCMDAHDLRFEDNSFNFILSRSVFQHLRDPQRALMEAQRVLRPGGIGLIGLHLWTAPNGYTHTPVDYATADWPHLQGIAQPQDIDASRNRIRLAQWQQIFHEITPTSQVNAEGPDSLVLRDRARFLKQAGRLSEYTLEELVSWGVTALWKKPF